VSNTGEGLDREFRLGEQELQGNLEQVGSNSSSVKKWETNWRGDKSLLALTPQHEPSIQFVVQKIGKVLDKESGVGEHVC
jgi:hypothetical protein